MKLHANATLGPKGRLVMVRRVVEEGWSLAAAAEAAGVSERTVGKWVARYRVEGELGLVDRSSAPRSVPLRTGEDRRQLIASLRRLRFTGPEISELLGMALSTVSGLLKEMGMGKLGRLGLEPAARYERERPGELIHIDVKKLGRIARPGHAVLGGQPARGRKGYHRTRDRLGWEFVHVAVDDCTRLAYVEVLADEKATTVAGFLGRAVALLRPPWHPRRAAAHRQRLGVSLDDPRHRLPRARRPPPQDAALPTPDQRQSRALHPHPARRLGLRRALCQQRRTHRSP